MDARREANLISKYLIGCEVNEKEIELYSTAMKKLEVNLNEREIKIWNFILNNAWSLGSLDAVLAFKNPEGAIRKKIFVMLAVLEANTMHTKKFLPIGFGFFSTLTILWAGMRSIFRFLFGSILIKFI